MTLHHLDALLDLPGRPGPSEASLAEVVRTFTALAEVELDGDPVAWALAGGGRVPLSAEQRARLGSAATRFPLVV